MSWLSSLTFRLTIYLLFLWGLVGSSNLRWMCYIIQACDVYGNQAIGESPIPTQQKTSICIRKINLSSEIIVYVDYSLRFSVKSLFRQYLIHIFSAM